MPTTKTQASTDGMPLIETQEKSPMDLALEANPAPNILLMGMPGSGKTHSLRTLLDAGKEVFIVFTEPGMDVLSDTDPDQCHWQYIKPTTGNLEDMLKQIKSANITPWETIQKGVDHNKKNHNAAVKLMESLVNFKCDRTGKEFGNVGNFNHDQALVIDSLSGINLAAQQLIVGGALGMTLPMWGACMKVELNLINQMCFDSKCIFVLTAHLDRIQDEVQGGMIIQVNALGKKNAPEIPKNFSDVILCKHEKSEFLWATESAGADLKARNVDWSKKLKPSFVPLLDRWEKRLLSTVKQDN